MARRDCIDPHSAAAGPRRITEPVGGTFRKLQRWLAGPNTADLGEAARPAIYASSGVAAFCPHTAERRHFCSITIRPKSL